jgi:hypothetical protein
MEQPRTAIERLFETFESNNSTGDIPTIVSQFADPFMAAGPNGSTCVRAADFALALPKRKQLFESLGSKSTTLVSLDESPLDARYVLAKTRWQMNFDSNQRGKQQVIADSVYILDTSGEMPKIILYLANQDIMAVLKDRGILPA